MSKTSCQRNEKHRTKADVCLSVCLICIFLFSIVATGLVPADAWADGCIITTGSGSVVNPTNSTVTCTGTCNDSQIGLTNNTTNNATINVVDGATLSNARIYVGTNGIITTSGRVISTGDNTADVFGVILLNSGSHATVNPYISEGTDWSLIRSTKVSGAAIQKVSGATGTFVTVNGGKLTKVDGVVGFVPIYDKYTDGEGMNITITGGVLTGSNNSIELNSSSGNTVSVTGGTLTGNIMLNAGNNVLTVSGSPTFNNFITMGDDNDTMTVSGSPTFKGIDMGDGNNTLTVSGSPILAEGFKVEMGDGNDTLTLNTTTPGFIATKYADGGEGTNTLNGTFTPDSADICIDPVCDSVYRNGTFTPDPADSCAGAECDKAYRNFVVASPTPPSPEPPYVPPCSLQISPFNPSMTGDAGTTTYNVSNAVGYTNVSWTASVWQGGDWFTITSGASGTDSGTITCSFTANPSTAVARVAYIGIVPSDGLCQGRLGIMVTQNPLSASATILWTKTDGTAWVWPLDATGLPMGYGRTYGPFTGWTADSYHREVGSEGTAQMLWNHINGTASIQFMNDMGDMGNMEYGPEAGWTAVRYHLNSNGTAQMLWNHTDGTASVWTLNVRGIITSRILYGPYTDSVGTWIAADYRQNSDGTANMLWVRTDAYTSVWTLDSSGDMTSRIHYGPFTDETDTYLWYAKSYLRNSDGTANMLWSRNGNASVWTLNSSGNMINRIYYGTNNLDWIPQNFDKIR